MKAEAYLRALAFAARKHEGQFRIGGLPYITHPEAVAGILRDWGYDTEYQIAGLFHDLLEDTDAREAEIEALGGPRVLAAVRLLTKREGYVMADYVAGIKADPMARAVKAADRLHNLRCAVAAGEDFRRRYILESIDWYLDLAPEIPGAVRALAGTLSRPIRETPLEYRPVEPAEELRMTGGRPQSVEKEGVDMTERCFPASDTALPDVLAFAEAALEGVGCPRQTQMLICVALEEVFINVAHYAYPDKAGEARLAFGFDRETREAVFRLCDGGVPFDPLERPLPDTTLPAEQRPIGGLGILITRKIMDEVTYRYEAGENRLTMRKKI